MPGLLEAPQKTRSMWIVEPGARLTILAPDGAVLWSGTVASRRLGLLGLLGETTLAPPGIEPAQWRGWFERSPPLAARYLPPHRGT